MVLSRRLEYISVEIIKKICFGFFRKTTYHFRCTSSIFPLNMNYTIKPVMPLLQQFLLIIIIIIIIIIIVIVMIITH